ncbi:MAG: DNA-binding protein WhiA [Bacilli bacterium]|nr:DNA-binding protein WhiA [Bacilli bacterium]
MSFSNNVKKELSSIPLKDCCLKAELVSFIRLRSNDSITSDYITISFSTTQISAVRRMMFLLRKLYNAKVDIKIKKKKRPHSKSYYWLNVSENIGEILKDLSIVDSEYKLSPPVYSFENDCCKASILRGAFLARGSINNPYSKDYHLEITTPTLQEAVFLQNLLKEINVEAKTIKRSKGTVLYIKKGEQIADFLKFVGASNSLFAFEDVRIKKDLNNYVNRIMNCDVANEQKAIATAAKQLENIEYLEKHYGLIDLTPRLIDAIILRTNHPDDSLSQLSDKSADTVNRYISKSGLSHCFKDIERLVNKIKKE